MTELSTGVVMKLITAIMDHGIDGIGPLSSAASLAEEYRKDASYESTGHRVSAMIRWEASKNFGTGFVTGLGGLITLPVSVPAALYASWVVQARLAAGISDLHGHSTKEDRVRTLVLLSLIGDAGKEVMKEAGVKIANKVATNVVRQIPGKVLIEINKKVGFRLLTKAGEKGVINLMKAVPIAGGVVSGGVDAVSALAVGKTANSVFGP